MTKQYTNTREPGEFGDGVTVEEDESVVAKNATTASAALPHMGRVSVKDALAQLYDAIAREAKEREIADHVFTTLHVNIEKSEPTAEFAEALRDYWLKEGKPALASHDSALRAEC